MRAGASPGQPGARGRVLSRTLPRWGGESPRQCWRLVAGGQRWRQSERRMLTRLESVLHAEPTVCVTVKVTASQRAKLARFGGGKWVRSKLDAEQG